MGVRHMIKDVGGKVKSTHFTHCCMDMTPFPNIFNILNEYLFTVLL